MERTKTIPLLNISKDDYPLKTEVKHFLDKHEINPSMLHFKEDVNLIEYHREKRLKLVLVDRNTLSNEEEYLRPSVTYIVDHHQKQWVDDERLIAHFPFIYINYSFIFRVETKIEKVGSCCTLIAELILNSSLTIDKQLAEMLYCKLIIQT